MKKHFSNALTGAWRCVFIAAGVVAAAGVSAQVPVLTPDSLPNKNFNKHGNILIADQFNNRVIED